MLLGSWLASNLEFDHETTPSPHENSMQPWQVPKPNAYQFGQFYATEIALWVEGVSKHTPLVFNSEDCKLTWTNPLRPALTEDEEELWKRQNTRRHHRTP